MKRRYLIGLILALAVGAGLWWWGENNRREFENMKPVMARSPLAEADADPALPTIQGPPRLAIGPLGSGSPQEDAALADLALAELSGVEGLELVERRELDRALQEAGLSMAGLSTGEAAVQAARLVRANLFLLGSPTIAGGKPAALTRLVDAQTGIIRDLVLLQQPAADLPRSAQDLAKFLQTALSGTNAAGHVYLALGSFQNLSPNNRLADFPSRLLPWLQQAYRGSEVTLLEREAVSTLLQESRLALGGLTDDATPPPPMRSAVWLVGGIYQAFESGTNTVDLLVQVERVRGPRFSTPVRGPIDTNLFGRVKAAVDAAMEEGRDWVFPPNRKAEIAAHMEKGSRLAGMINDVHVSQLWNKAAGEYVRLNQGEFTAGAVQDLRDAIREFETVLLLDPDHLEARRRLACCLIDQRIGQVESARDRLREIIAIGKDSREAWSARAWLAESYLGRDNRRAVELARHYLGLTGRTNGTAALEQTETRALQLLFQEDEIGKEEYAPVVERSIFEALRREHEHLLNRDKDLWTGGLSALSPLYGWNSAEVAAALERLLPRLEAEFPALRPYLRARAVTFQTDTNAPAITRFKEDLAHNAAHPDEVRAASDYFGKTLGGPFSWAQKRRRYDVMFQIREVREAMAARDIAPAPDDRFYVRLAFAYDDLKDWQSALEVLEPMEGRTVKMNSNGPWGSYRDPFDPAKAAAFCRKQLGLTLTTSGDSKQFSLGREGIALDRPLAVAVQQGRVLVAGGIMLMALTADPIKLMGRMRLPLPDPGPEMRIINCLAADDQTAWIGTAGSGLLEVNLETKEVRPWTAEKDGLTMDHISALHMAHGRLWIGFAGEGTGGLAVLDLATRSLRRFTPTLREDISQRPDMARAARLDSSTGPPRLPVTSIATRGEHELWLGVFEKGLQLYDLKQDQWMTLGVRDAADSVSCVAAAGRHVVAGCVEARRWIGEDPLRGGISVFEADTGTRDRRDYGEKDGLPADRVTAVALDGTHVWVGGRNSLVVLDAESGKVERTSTFKDGDVHQICPAGRYVWINVGSNVYRLVASEIYRTSASL